MRREWLRMAKTAAAFSALGFAVATAYLLWEGGDTGVMATVALVFLAAAAFSGVAFFAVVGLMKIIGCGYDYRLDAESLRYVMTGGSRYLLGVSSVAVAAGNPVNAPGAALALGGAAGRVAWSALREREMAVETFPGMHALVLRSPRPAVQKGAEPLDIYLFCGTAERLAAVEAFVEARLRQGV